MFEQKLLALPVWGVHNSTPPKTSHSRVSNEPRNTLSSLKSLNTAPTQQNSDRHRQTTLLFHSSFGSLQDSLLSEYTQKNSNPIKNHRMQFSSSTSLYDSHRYNHLFFKLILMNKKDTTSFFPSSSIYTVEHSLHCPTSHIFNLNNIHLPTTSPPTCVRPLHVIADYRTFPSITDRLTFATPTQSVLPLSHMIPSIMDRVSTIHMSAD